MSAGAVPACEVSWTGGSGDWGTAANWSTGVVPTATDDVCISGAADILLVGDRPAGTLSLTADPVGTPTLRIVSTSDAAARLIVSGATVMNAGTIVLDNVAGSFCRWSWR